MDRFVVEQPVLLLAPLRGLEDLRSVFGRVSGIRLNDRTRSTGRRDVCG